MRSSDQGFTRVELIAASTALLLIGFSAVRLLAASSADSKRALCYNNLRQIGGAALSWGNDHADFFPWTTYVSQGGTRPDRGYKVAVAWAEFISLSNQITHPRILACPSDPGANRASNWSTGAGGFANPAHRANALSYFVTFDTGPAVPRSVLSGDRDFRPATVGPVVCGRGPSNASAVDSNDRQIAWTNAVHSFGGHLLLGDGSVEFTSSALLYTNFNDVVRNFDGAMQHFVNTR